MLWWPARSSLLPPVISTFPQLECFLAFWGPAPSAQLPRVVLMFPHFERFLALWRPTGPSWHPLLHLLTLDIARSVPLDYFPWWGGSVGMASARAGAGTGTGTAHNFIVAKPTTCVLLAARDKGAGLRIRRIWQRALHLLFALVFGLGTSAEAQPSVNPR